MQRMANRRQRDITNAGIGTTITDPNIDYATLARSMGLYGEGPITDPKDLGPALQARRRARRTRRNGACRRRHATPVGTPEESVMRLLLLSDLMTMASMLGAQTPVRAKRPAAPARQCREREKDLHHLWVLSVPQLRRARRRSWTAAGAASNAFQAFTRYIRKPRTKCRPTQRKSSRTRSWRTSTRFC